MPGYKATVRAKGQYLSLITILNVATDKTKVDSTRCIEQHKASKYRVTEKQEGNLFKEEETHLKGKKLKWNILDFHLVGICGRAPSDKQTARPRL